MNIALVLSGGVGSRIPGRIPKQYLRVGGRMLITYALEPVFVSPDVDLVEIVAGRKWREQILAEIGQTGLPAEKFSGFADPGENRQESVLNGLRRILEGRGEAGGRTKSETGNEAKNETKNETGDKAGDRAGNGKAPDTVLIHDAARPRVSVGLIRACYEAFPGHDGVMPVLPVKDTVYWSRDGRGIHGLLDRKCVYAGQAPELFHLEKYYQANAALTREQLLRISGSAQPAVMAGMEVVMIPGDERNFKVTTETDLQRFRRSL